MLVWHQVHSGPWQGWWAGGKLCIGRHICIGRHFLSSKLYCFKLIGGKFENSELSSSATVLTRWR